jgi:hypothetical protein
MWWQGTGGETVAQSSSVGDSASSRLVYFIVVALVLLAAGLLWFSYQYWRRTRPGSEAVFVGGTPKGSSHRSGAGPTQSRRAEGSARRDYPGDRPARPRSGDPRIDPRVEPRRASRAPSAPDPRTARARPDRRDGEPVRRPPRRDDPDLASLLEDDPNAYRRGPAVRRSSDPPRDPLL